jgi:hypothetical protein
MKAKDKHIDILRLHELLSYDDMTGIFTWKLTGNSAGNIGAHGYVILIIDKKRYLGHRLAWYWVHWKWPSNFIDHIDGCRSNNAIANLRDVTYSQNKQNTKRAYKNNKVGLQGVRVQRRHKTKFQAQITVNKRVMNLGFYDTPEEAHAVYIEAKRKYHECCTI